MWDIPTRLSHAGLALGVVAAWSTGTWWLPQSLDLHTGFGGLVLGVLLARGIWGAFGPGPSRFSDFVHRPARILRALRSGSELRVGHDPVAGAWMFGMLAVAGVTGLTGVAVLGGEEGLGPARALVGYRAATAVHVVHGLAADLLVAMAAVHVGAVVLRSVQHRVFLPVAMVTGRRPATPRDDLSPARPGRALATALAVLVVVVGSIRSLDALPDTRWQDVTASSSWRTWTDECGACHDAWHPSLLESEAWVAVLGTLDDHWGEDASLPPDVTAELSAFAIDYGAERFDTEASWLVRGDEGPGITERSGWKSRHAGLDEDVFERPDVGSPGHCEACHDDAPTGRFDGRRIAVPAAAPESVADRLTKEVLP